MASKMVKNTNTPQERPTITRANGVQPGPAAPTQNAPYKYQDLSPQDGFRLLELHCGGPSDDLSCHLIATTIESSPPFEAISYCWGGQAIRSNMNCDNQTIGLTENLGHILRQLRLPLVSRTLWVDQVCINQENKKERAQQVGLMRRIYKRAATVLICPGPDNGEASTCAELIIKIKQRCNLLQAHHKLHSQTNQKENLLDQVQAVGMKDLPSVDAPEWAALARMFDRPWFSRIWVIQEVAESSRAIFRYGNAEIDWPLIRLVAFWIVHGSQEPTILAMAKTRGIHNATFMAAEALRLESASPALELFHIGRDFKASDPRDKIFAMLNHPIKTPRPPSPLKYLIPIILQIIKLLGQVYVGCGALAFAHLVFSGVNANLQEEEIFAKTVFIVAPTFLLLEYNTILKYYRPGLQFKRFLVLNTWGETKLPIPRFIIISLVLAFSIVCCFYALLIWGFLQAWFFSSILIFLLFPTQQKPEAYYTNLRTESGIINDTNVWETSTPLAILNIDVNYSKSLEQTYRDVALNVMGNLNNLECLSYVLHGREIKSDIPSWVPRWDTGTAAITILSKFTIQPFKASFFKRNLGIIVPREYAILDKLPFFRICGGNIIVHGFIIDRINEELRSFEDRFSRDGLFPINEKLKNYPDGSSIVSAVSSTLTASRRLDGSRSEQEDNISSLNQMEPNSQWELAARRVCAYRKYFNTVNDYLGLGPEALRSGDLVCVILGCSVPYVLRKHGDLYQLVGESYLHGYMDGEAVREWSEKKRALDKFEIC